MKVFVRCCIRWSVGLFVWIISFRYFITHTKWCCSKSQHTNVSFLAFRSRHYYVEFCSYICHGKVYTWIWRSLSRTFFLSWLISHFINFNYEIMQSFDLLIIAKSIAIGYSKFLVVIKVNKWDWDVNVVELHKLRSSNLIRKA